MRLIVDYFYSMLLTMLWALPVVLLFRLFRSRFIKTNIRHEVGVIVFLLYLVGMISLTVVPNFGDPFFIDTARINLIPFLVFPETWYEVFVNGNISYFLINFLGNIIMFVPIGFCIPLLWRASLAKTVLLGVSSTLFIELCQLPQARGSDIDDLWLNTLGVLLGCFLFRFVAKHRKASGFRIKRPV